MICFNCFQPQWSKKSPKENFKRKPGILYIIRGEKNRLWPTNRLSYKE
jgi:hypothetical protein